MKNTFVRAVVMTLTVAGLAAPSMTPAKKPAPAKTVASSFSLPLCIPTPQSPYCGMQ